MLLLLPDPFQGTGACWKTMKPQKQSNSSGPAPEVLQRQKIAKEQAAQRVRSWTVQNGMRGVLGRASAGAASRNLGSANDREIEA